MKNDNKPIQKRVTNMKKDFKQFFIQQPGQSLVKQGQFQEVQQSQKDQKNELQNQSSDNQFEQIDDQDSNNQGGIKSAQFWNGIKMPSNAPSVSKDAVKWQVRCAMSTGFNSLGRDNIFYLNGKICKGAGCVLIYNEQIYQKHSQKITTIAYNSKSYQILTATQGSCPQLFLWGYDSQNETIEWKKRFFIGKKCEDIYAISFFKERYIVAVEKFTLHKSSNMHIFDKVTGKKLTTLKVGKFYDLELLSDEIIKSQEEQEEQQSPNEEDQKESGEQRLYFANDQGIFEVILSKKDDKQLFKTEKVYQSRTVTCLCPFYSSLKDSQQKVEILSGDKQGRIISIFKKKQLKVHDGWIFQIKHKQINNINYFFSLGAIDCHLAILSYQNNEKFNIFHKINLSGYGRCIESYDDNLLIGKRDGSYEEFSIQQLVSQKSTTKITRKQQLSLKCFQSKQKINKSFIVNLPNKQLQNQGKKVYAYGNSESKLIRFFNVQNTQQGVIMTNINNYALRSYPQALDISNNLLAYTYDVQNVEQKQSIQSQSISSMFSKATKSKQKQFEKSILVIEDYKTKQLIAKMQVKVQLDKDVDKNKCTVIKFSPLGKYLVMGNSEGNVFVYQVNRNKIKNQGLSQEEFKLWIKSEKKLHKQAIKQLIWSRQQKYIKSVSISQVFYWQIPLNKQQGDNNKQVVLQQCKAMKVRDVNWLSLGRFGWQVKDIWQKSSLLQELSKFWLLQYTSTQIEDKGYNKEISTDKRQMILGCSIDGSLRIYNYPACSNKYQEIKLNNNPFQLIEYFNDQDSFSFLVIIEGIVIVIQLSNTDKEQSR